VVTVSCKPASLVASPTAALKVFAGAMRVLVQILMTCDAGMPENDTAARITLRSGMPASRLCRAWAVPGG